MIRLQFFAPNTIWYYSFHFVCTDSLSLFFGNYQSILSSDQSFCLPIFIKSLFSRSAVVIVNNKKALKNSSLFKSFTANCFIIN